jgi:TrmH family RNA methyltransferase
MLMTLLGGFWRFWRLGQQAYWTDEAATIDRIRGSLEHMARALSNQGFPPGWYAMLRGYAVYGERWLPQPAGPLCVYLHGVHDPGNVGAVLRGAEAFGASSVVLGPGCADPFGPKAVRASMGAIFTVPLARGGEMPGVKVALVPHGGRPLRELCAFASEEPRKLDEACREVTLMVGSERDGLPEELVRTAEHTAHIPIGSHSLNAAMAATIALYELSHRIRQR